VVGACAISAGAHDGLVPEHLREAPQLGVAFVVAAGLLVAADTALAIRPGSLRATRGAALLLAGLIGFYAASRITGIPLWSRARSRSTWSGRRPSWSRDSASFSPCGSVDPWATAGRPSHRR
jgi:hypothetical protein